MLLAIDIGNTNTVIGLLEGKVLRHRWRVGSEARRTSDELGILLRDLCREAGVELDEVTGAAVCSVVPALTGVWVETAERLCKTDPVVVGPDLDLGISIDYRDPTEVGPDRLANAVGVRELVEGPAIVVDFGTATTFDVISEDGCYLGGAIAPGLLTSVENLFRSASLLHGVALDPPTTAIGKSTEESLRAGIIYGVVGQVDEIVRRICAEWDEEPTVVATGGLAEKLSIFSRSIKLAEPDLTLLGLAAIYERVTSARA
jgi:type III pantothenate kinase